MMVAAIYPYFLAAHVTAVVFLVGGLLAQERIINAIPQSPPETQAGVLVALQRLERTVTTPALLLTWILGLSLALSAGWLSSGWLIVKLIFVVALSALHGVRSGRIRRSLRTRTAIEKIPGADLGVLVAMLVIAVLAIVKPA
ncbi:CopD family protein [Caldimonas taiwanensis]|uniref:CopD family protein n=1 Tax=Caldimonas taiwanensis TaxID=307483 RepID=UPI000AAC93E2|nr:CopD family protein [Caldimonas taiwanensis]